MTGVVTSPGFEGTFGYDQLDATCQVDGPRPLVLVDGPPGTKIMPMAGEFSEGNVEVFYNSLVKELSTTDAPIPAFPPRSISMAASDKARIWQALSAGFEPKVAMNILERAGNSRPGMRFEWIDFRLPWCNQGDPSPLHLHLVPAGKYSMGTFAHAFVNRSYREGVRLVGALKSGGDINVMAVYER